MSELSEAVKLVRTALNILEAPSSDSITHVTRTPSDPADLRRDTIGVSLILTFLE